MNGQNNLIVCDKCGHEFMMSDVKIEQEKLKGNRTGMYFNCRKCKEKYPFASITEKGQILQKELKSLGGQAKLLMTDKDRNKFRQKYNSVFHRYQQEVSGPYKDEEVLRIWVK